VPQDLPRRGALATSHDEHGLRAGAKPPAKDQRMLLLSYQRVEMLLARNRKYMFYSRFKPRTIDFLLMKCVSRHVLFYFIFKKKN